MGPTGELLVARNLLVSGLLNSLESRLQEAEANRLPTPVNQRTREIGIRIAVGASPIKFCGS
jgi:hypothetical protein